MTTKKQKYEAPALHIVEFNAKDGLCEWLPSGLPEDTTAGGANEAESAMGAHGKSIWVPYSEN